MKQSLYKILLPSPFQCNQIEKSIPRQQKDSTICTNALLKHALLKHAYNLLPDCKINHNCFSFVKIKLYVWFTTVTIFVQA